MDIRSIGGLNDEINRKLSQQIRKLLKDSLGIAPDGVYLNFTGVEVGNWGWNGSTLEANGSEPEIACWLGGLVANWL